MNITILGSSSATPIYDRHPSSQILTVNDYFYLIDCGEGTLFRLNEFKIKKNKIRTIFISHLHGDHFYGLIGLLTTMSMQERTEVLTIVSPPRLREIIEIQCDASKTTIRFPIHYTEFSHEVLSIYEDENIRVQTLPLDHKIETCGFLFEKIYPKYRVLKDKIVQYQLTHSEIAQLVKGEELVSEMFGLLTLADISEENKETKKFAYCSDTQYSESYLDYIQEIDVLYHESTFLEQDKKRAIDTKHSTAKQAAVLAKKAAVKKLLIGHFSARYIDLNPLLEEAKLEFQNTELALEGRTFEI